MGRHSNILRTERREAEKLGKISKDRTPETKEETHGKMLFQKSRKMKMKKGMVHSTEGCRKANIYKDYKYPWDLVIWWSLVLLQEPFQWRSGVGLGAVTKQ